MRFETTSLLPTVFLDGEEAASKPSLRWFTLDSNTGAQEQPVRDIYHLWGQSSWQKQQASGFWSLVPL